MARFSIDETNLELTGTAVRSLFVNAFHPQIKPILDKHGVSEIDPDGWYSMALLKEIFKDISERGDSIFNFVAIGIAAAEISPLPPDVLRLSPLEFYAAYNEVFQTRHRGGNPGGLIAEPANDNTVRITLVTPYPDEVMYGLMYGFAKRLLPTGTHITVRYVDDSLRRDLGSEETVLLLRWED